MDRRYSLRGRSDFRRLYREGKTWSGRGLRIRYLLEPVDHIRFAVSVPRACGKAVARNRIRRVIREALRVLLPEFPGGTYHFRVQSFAGRPTRAGASDLLQNFAVSLKARS